MRSFFNAAIIERSVSAAQEAQKQIKTTEYLRKETTAIIKLSENILRKEDGMNSFIKDYREDLQTEFVQEILIDRKSTRLNSSHVAISYAVFCLKKKNKQ